jgi:hypothetical protein
MQGIFAPKSTTVITLCLLASSKHDRNAAIPPFPGAIAADTIAGAVIYAYPVMS